jgi:hypothetical protein
MMNIPSSAIYGRDIHRGNVFGLSARLITDTTTTVTKELHFVLLVIIIPGIHRLQSALSMDPPSYYSLETNTILNEFVSTAETLFRTADFEVLVSQVWEACGYYYYYCSHLSRKSQRSLSSEGSETGVSELRLVP